jgi:O-succinylbenzoic acid--CoA ligase
VEPACSLPHSLAHYLADGAARWPQALAVHCPERQWTYPEWLTRISALAETIEASRQVLRVSGSSFDLASHAFACSLKNRPFFPVDRNARKMALADANFLATNESLPPDIAVVIATSGSEGAPRHVMLSDANLDAAAAAANRHLQLQAGDLWLNCLPLHHIGGLSILWRCARAGAATLLPDGFVAAATATALSQHPVSHLSLVPAMLAGLLDTGVRPPASLRHVVVGGAALPMNLYRHATAAGWPLNPSYGMSETAAQVATYTLADGPWHEGLVGRPLGSTEFTLTADSRIRIRGPQVMAGYVEGGGIDADGWLTTGDLGKIDEKGRLTVTGRADDMLISGGCNVHPLEVESCLAGCPGIHDSAVTGLPDETWGDLVIALVVGDATPAAIEDWCRTRLPAAARPRRIVRLANLPRNATGKLERSTLRRLAREAAA